MLHHNTLYEWLVFAQLRKTRIISIGKVSSLYICFMTASFGILNKNIFVDDHESEIWSSATSRRFSRPFVTWFPFFLKCITSNKFKIIDKYMEESFEIKTYNRTQMWTRQQHQTKFPTIYTLLPLIKLLTSSVTLGSMGRTRSSRSKRCKILPANCRYEVTWFCI